MAPRIVMRQVAPAAAPGAGAGAVSRGAARGQVVQRVPVTGEITTAGTGALTPATATETVEVRRTASPMTEGVGPGGLGVDVDRLIEAIEQRVVDEIERRGGRYTGVF